MREQFENVESIEVHLAPPLLARRDSSGNPRKRGYGPWMLGAFRVLAALRFLRGTPFDPFGYSEERRAERRLIAEYEATVDEILERLTPATLAVSVALASVPERIRGYGHIKRKAMREAAVDRKRLLERLREPVAPSPLRIAAE